MEQTDEVLLVVEGGPDNQEKIPLLQGTTTIGRQSCNDVVLADLGVSRRHAEVNKVAGGYCLRDRPVRMAPM